MQYQHDLSVKQMRSENAIGWSHSMKRLIGMVTFVVLASTGPMVRAAAAKDFCISLNSGGGIVVGQRFKVPRPGKCKLFNGFSQNDPTTLVSGNACGTSDG